MADEWGKPVETEEWGSPVEEKPSQQSPVIDPNLASRSGQVLQAGKEALQ